MKPVWRAVTIDRATLATAALLLLTTAAAWNAALRSSSQMDMAAPGRSLVAEGVRFTLMWGVMMAAMMLPSAAPMILLYRTVSLRLAESGDSAASPVLFTAVYLLVWLAVGAPVYAMTVAVRSAVARWPVIEPALPYAVAAALAAAGAYQLTPLKSACLRRCESPLAFLMQRWRPGHAATVEIALAHATYCLGCCWGLMAILVAAGAMSIPWVLSISVLVFAEKVIPGGQRIARVTGWLLILLAAGVALRPELAGTLTFSTPAAMPSMPMDR